MLTKQNIDFFWDRVEKRENGCWIWTGSVATSGYPITYLHHDDRKPTKGSARRFAWCLLKDPTEAGGINACKDDRMCVNPDHMTVNHSKASDITPERVEEMRRSLAYWFASNKPRRKVSMY